jgi:hypothetical protein
VTVFSFPYREERSRAGRLIFRPSVTAELQDADGRWHPFRLYADAGADITLLREADCRTLGYELEAGEEQFMGGIGPGLIRTFVHQVRVRLGTVDGCRLSTAGGRPTVPLTGSNTWTSCARPAPSPHR